MDLPLQDVRYAIRTLLRAPALTAGAVLTTALAIGGGTAIFSVVNTVLLRPLPFGNGERLVRVQQTIARPDGGTGRVAVSHLNFAALRERSRTIEIAVAHRFRSFTTGGDGGPERLVGIQVSDRWLATVGVRPVLGRGFSAAEERAGEGARVAVIGHGLWQRRFGGAADVVGRTIRLDGAPHTIVGVMPAGYAYPYSSELWVPMAIDPGRAAPRDLNITARLRAGVTHAQLEGDLDRVAEELTAMTAANRGMSGLAATPMRTELVGDFRRVLLTLLAAVGFVILIACVNVANLLLARATARRQEFGIRAALGASRARQIRQLLTESLLLASVGGALGVLLTTIITSALGALIPETMREVIPAVRVDGWLLAFAGALCLITGIAFGLAPAWRASAPSLVDSLRSGGSARATGGLGLLNALVVAEIAVAVVLLAGGGLLLRDLQLRFATDLGVATDGVLTLNVAFPESRFADAEVRTRFVGRVEERLSSLPGVHAAGASTIIPFGSGNTMATIDMPGLSADSRASVNHRLVTPGYFAAMGIRLIRGRLIESQDAATSAPVAVISESMARRYWPGEDPIGRQIRQAGGENPWLTVVGVVGDVAEREVPETWYLPYAQGAPSMPVSWATLRIVLVVRSAVEPAALTRAARRAVSEVDPDVPVFDVATVDRLLADTFGAQRLGAAVMGAFAALGLLLAALGVYGVVSYATSRRMREIGIRVALGADGRQVVRAVMIPGVRLVLVGVGVGLVGALVATRFIGGLLAEVSPRDPATLLTVSILLAAVGVVAGYLPARRAARVDPMVVLRRD